ncbi:MAG TPA: alpha/beta fold hydrolase [Pyrinomonadaceae bacterium]|jgi:predicted esterase
MLQQDLNLTAEIKLYYDLFVPETAAPRAPLLVAVHGYGAHKRYMMREAQRVAPENFAVASIQAPYQHFRPTADGYKIGFGWLTDYKAAESVALHHDFVDDVVDRLAAEEIVDPEKVYLYGFSQACALNFRYAFTFPERVRGVVGVCGGIPGDLETNELYRPTDADTFYLYNDDDEFYPLEKYESFAAKLDAFLPNFESKLYHAKHEITEPMRDDIKRWLKEKAESL